MINLHQILLVVAEEIRSMREVASLNTPSRLYLPDSTVRIESIEIDDLQLHYTVK